MKYIKIGSLEEIIAVKDIYAYTYDHGDGKTVLRIKIDADTKSFDELKSLLTNGNAIYVNEERKVDYHPTAEEQENGTPPPEDQYEMVLIDTHVNFCKDYKCEYNSVENEFDIEITKKNDSEIAAQKQNDDILDAYLAITEIYEM